MIDLTSQHKQKPSEKGAISIVSKKWLGVKCDRIAQILVIRHPKGFRMSKQSSLFGFVARRKTSRDDANATKFDSESSSIETVSVPAKTNKFKYVQPKSKKPLESNTSNIAKIPTVDLVNVAQPIKIAFSENNNSLIEISDDSNSPKKVAKPKDNEPLSEWGSKNDDFFESLSADAMALAKPSQENKKTITTTTKTTAAPTKTTTNKSKITLDDLYSKYGSPEKDESIETSPFKSNNPLDIDKALNSNIAYVQAMKKLDANMQQLEAKGVKKYNAPTSTVTSKTITSQHTTNGLKSTNCVAVAKNTSESTEKRTPTVDYEFKSPSSIRSPPLNTSK